jgi:hypothetical protein
MSPLTVRWYLFALPLWSENGKYLLLLPCAYSGLD